PNCGGEDDGWEEYAETRDPNWGCRKKYLLIFTDGDVTCQEGGNACNATANMNSQLGVETFVVAYGTSSDEQQPGGGNQSTLTCLPANSGAGNGQEIGALFPHNRQELLDALKLIFSAIVGRTATFSAAAVPSVQAEALDKLFLTSLSPVNEQSVWPGRMDAFLKPLPLDVENRPDTTKTCPDPSNNASNCHLWNAADVMLATQITPSDPVGQTPAQRRIAYAQFPLDASVPWVQESFETSTNRTVDIEVERDFWRGLGITFIRDDTASEDAARTESDGVVTETLAVKTGILPPPDETEIDYIMGEIFHSDPGVVGSPTNNLYFIADLGTDGSDSTDCGDADERGYRCFFFRHQKRRKVLGAGSNDGMIHLWDIGAWSTSGDFVDRFDNGSGKEVFAYMPRTVMPVVKRMTEDPIAPQYAVDGRPAAADVFIDPVHDGTPTETEREWRTVMMGGLRSGGWTTLQGFSHLEGPVGSEAQKAAGYFLLDITQPDPVSLDDADFVPAVQDPPACLVAGTDDCGPVAYGAPLWEFTDTIPGVREEGDPDDPSDNVIVGVRLDEGANGFIDLAPTWSTPNFGRMRICVDAGGGPNCNVADPASDVEVRHVAVFGGGLDENEASFHARGNFLYIVDVETGRTLYKHRLDGAAPSEPAAVDTNLDGFLDTIYIGTSYGFLYRADLEAIVGANVLAPQLADVMVSGTMADGTLVTETQQRITDPLYQPHLLFNANDASVDDVIIGVAAGTLQPQQMYYRPSVIFVPNLDRYALGFGTGNRADLFDRGETAGGRFFVVVDDVTSVELQDPLFTPIGPADIPRVDLLDPRTTDDLLVDVGGWWFQLAPNQRVVTETFALSGILFFSSFIPADQAIIVESGPGPNPPQPDDFFCREAGTSQIFATLATNGNGLLYVPNEAEAVRFRTVEDLATRPYTEVSQTANPVPDEPPPPLTDELLKIQEELKDLFPANCKFPPGYNIGVKTRVTDTGIEFIAPVPICVIEKNFRDY
ncbi:MAG: pilus assembly protein, partial [Thermoanaerobaculia bacterium]